MASQWNGIPDEAGAPYVTTSQAPGLRVGRDRVGAGRVGSGAVVDAGSYSVSTSVPIEAAEDTIGAVRLSTYYKGLDGFTYPNVPAGKGRLALYFADFEAAGPGENVMTIMVNGKPLVAGLDPYALAGANTEYVLKPEVDCPGGAFRVDITATAGHTFLNDATLLRGTTVPIPRPPLTGGFLGFGWYGGNDASVVGTAEAMSGVQLQVLSIYVDSRFSISSAFEGPNGATAWLAGGGNRQVLLNVNIMIGDPGNFSNPNINSQMVAIANYLVAQGVDDRIILRVGYEANGDFGFPWQPRSQGNNFNGFINMWRSMHTAVEAVAAFQWDYCVVPWDNNTAEMLSMFPGRDYVSNIGLDLYDRDTFDGSTAANWTHHQNRAQLGINLAASVSRPWSIDESALWPSGVNGGAGDNPTWIRGIGKLAADQYALWWVYFDSNPDAPGFTLSDNPNSVDAFQSFWATTAAAA